MKNSVDAIVSLAPLAASREKVAFGTRAQRDFGGQYTSLAVGESKHAGLPFDFAQGRKVPFEFSQGKPALRLNLRQRRIQKAPQNIVG